MDRLILINKEMNMTSHDLVNIVRKSTRMKRVGHTGTLDPNATGLMVIAVNKATKLVNYLQYEDKEYIFEMELGVMTDTLDIWGTVVEKKEFNKPSQAHIEEVLKSFLGKSEQIPPMYSAIKVKGKKLYELARNNEIVERKPRSIEIYDIELLQCEPTIKIRVVCSSGTYIRSLVKDIAAKFNTIGVMSSLVRTRIGMFKLEDADSVDNVRRGTIKFVDPEGYLNIYHKVEYSVPSDIYNGKKIKLDCKSDLVLITINKKSVAFYEREKDNIFKCKRGLW